MPETEKFPEFQRRTLSLDSYDEGSELIPDEDLEAATA